MKTYSEVIAWLVDFDYQSGGYEYYENPEESVPFAGALAAFLYNVDEEQIRADVLRLNREMRASTR